MLSVTYPWKRFWCPRTGNLNLGYGGYLWDPDSEYASIYNPDVKSFSEIEHYAVLGLLGEPGIGKSFAIEQLVKTSQAYIESEGGHVLHLNLNAIGSEDRLERKLFGSVEFKSWETDKTPLYIFLDSFDECLLNIPTLSRLLSDELGKHSPHNLFIRIACRTFDWPIGLEESLVAKWGQNNVAVYELSPLRQIDVIEAASINGLNVVKFLQEIDSHEVVPLAIKPITLKMLIDVFKKEEGFPTSKGALYGKGCLALAEESSLSRRDAKQLGRLSPEQRVMVAARIAALTIFGGKNAIWAGPYSGEITEEDLTLADISGGFETVNGNKIEINELALREVLSNTGFFSSRGSHRLGWAHQTYAECLAARYLIHHKVNTEQTISLICNPEDSEKKLIPQLSEVSAWVASMDDSIFSHIVSTDPETLLKGDFVAIGVDCKRTLVQEFLHLYEKGDAVDSDWSLKDHYIKLAHPELRDQLCPYITDSSKNIIVRRVAIDIAEACNLNSLQQELLSIALNQAEDYHIRSQAVHAICLVCDENAKRNLKPLAFGQAGDDPDDELKGQVLRALWPTNIAAEELFSHLSPPQNENLFGAYDDFLSRSLSQGLTRDNILVALDWVKHSYPNWKANHHRRELIKSIFSKSWEFLDSAVIANAFLTAVSVLLKKYDLEPLQNLISIDKTYKRYLLIDALLSIPGDERLDAYLCSRANLVNVNDIPWLIDRSKNESQQVRQYLAELAEYVFDYQYADILLSACEKDPVFAEIFKSIREPVQLDSADAERMRRNHYGRDHYRERISPSPMERIVKNLEESEAGQVNIWPSLILNMTLDEYGTGGWPDADHRESCGWKAANAETKKRIIAATQNYLLFGTPEIESLFESSKYFRALASSYALKLIWKENPDFVLSLDSSTWKKWAKVILVNSSRYKEGQELLKLAYKHAPEQIIEGVLLIIDKEKQNQSIFFHNLKDIWDGRLSEAIFGKLNDSDSDLSVGAQGSLLGLLLEQEVSEAQSFTESLVSNPLPIDDIERKRALMAASNLLQYGPDAGWLVVWPAIQTDADFGHALMAIISGHEMIIPRLADHQATDLYIWLEQNPPHSKEKENDDHTRDTRDFKGTLFRHLKARGTHGACVGLAKIVSAFPEKAWLKWSLRECQSLYRRATWCPPSPQEILALSEDREHLLVRSGQELLEVIIASLKRLEKTLHGVTPMATFLWNGNRPRSENDFSDYIENHFKHDLKARGIIANREVEFRRLSQSGVGEKTDIVVDAVCQNGKQFETISVVIECKGCWNKDLSTAMESQLRNRYLIDDQHRFGLYLVGWFLCHKWDDDHYQKKDTLKLNLTYETAQAFFDKQAFDLSNGPKDIQAFVLNAALPE